MDSTIALIFTFSAILVLGGLLFVLISFMRHSPRTLDLDKYRSQWLTIETRLARDDPGTYALCVIDADKLLDKALVEKGIQGKVMADRMKRCQGKWTNGNGVWAAHKLRNRLVHEVGVTLEYERTRSALVAYKQALKDLGAI